MFSVLKGQDPNQIQAMAKYSNLDNTDERSYYANQVTAIAIAQLRMLGESFYKDDSWNEYELAADILGVAFMGLKGFKSEQVKDINSGQPNLDRLVAMPEDSKRGILSGIFSRGGKE